MTKTSSVMSTSNTCTQCGSTNKSGKRSCCARGGSWFEKCGDVGEAKFDHTWAEGIQACNGLTTSVPFQSPLQAMIHRVRIAAYRQNAAQLINISLHQTDMYRADRVTNADCVRLPKALVFIYFLSIVSWIDVF